MKTEIRTLTATVAMLSLAAVAQAQFTPGDLVVLRVGDGVNALVNSTGPMSLLEFNSGGTVVGSPVSVPSGNGGLQISGTATSEGQLVLNANQTALTLAGYVPPFTGSGSLSSRTSAQAPRGYVTIDYNRTVSSTTTLPNSPYSTQNIRSGFASGSGLWFTGSGTASGSGLVYYDGTSSSTIQGVNSRVLGYYGGDLFYSSGSGTQGIYKYNGLPTSPVNAAAFLTGVTGQGTSPYDFVLSPNGNTLYVADDGVGVQKFTGGVGNWTFAGNFTNGLSANKAYGLAVDFSGTDPVIYWTSPTNIWKATDTGSGALATSILSAGANYAFRGLEFAPIPEPSVGALIGIGLAAGWHLLRRNRKS